MCLFGLVPKGDQAVEYIDVYLQAARTIPADIYSAACGFIMGTWNDPYTFPRPADIRRSISEITRRLDACLDIQRRREARRQAMTPTQAQQLLMATLEEPEPTDDVGRAVRSIQIASLRRAAARRPMAVPALEARSAEDF